MTVSNNTPGKTGNSARRKLSDAETEELLGLSRGDPENGIQPVRDEQLAVDFGISYMTVRNIKKRAAENNQPATQ